MVVGESSTPLSNLLLEGLADRYDLPALKPLTKWGSWQRNYPELACGLKRGFTFYHHDLDHPGRRLASEQLLVAASPRDEIADTHWYRADLDQFLVLEAQRLGVIYVDEVRLDRFIDAVHYVLLEGSRGGTHISYRARFMVDASGPRGFLHHALGLCDAGLPGYPHTRAIYNHFTGVKRLDTQPAYTYPKKPPYTIDDSAVHHVFDGGWIWILQFNNGVTSAGIAATDECADRLALSEGKGAWLRLLSKVPGLEEQFATAKWEQPFTFVPRLPFRSSAMRGERWTMLPSAAGFVDPILSTGFSLTLLGVGRLAEIFEQSWNTQAFSKQIKAYVKRTEEELLVTARLVAALYSSMGNFSNFRALSFLYFAAASFSETAIRLGRLELARSFLLHDHPEFGRECQGFLDRISGGAQAWNSDVILREVYRIIEPIDVAGISKYQYNFSYPVVAQDLLDTAWKLGATKEEIVRLLERAGFYAAEAGVL